MSLFPLNDDNPIAIFPISTIALMAINILFFLIFNLFFSDSSLQHIFNVVGVIPAELLGSADKTGFIPEWLTLLTSAFFHVSFAHLALNMFFFYIFADNLEDAFGARRFITFCISAVIASSLLFAFTDQDSSIPTIGFSAVVTASMGAYLVLFPYAKIHVLVPVQISLLSGTDLNQELPALMVITLFMFLDFILFVFEYWFMMDITSQTGIAYAAHIYGFIFGIFTAKIFKKNETHYDFFN